MTALKRNFLKLNRLILFTALTATVITFINSLYSNYQVQKEQLIQQTMNINTAYAKKLSDTTELFINSSQQQLTYIANRSAAYITNSERLTENAHLLRNQTDTFDSVVIVNNQGVVLSVSPETLNLLGKQLKSVQTLKTLQAQASSISDPFVSQSDNLLVVLSEPIFDSGQNYLGYVAGTIYLKTDNLLSKILGQHYYRNGSYVYVVDSNKKFLYHPNKALIGTYATSYPEMDDILNSEEGGLLLQNSQGQTMLAGYAKIPSSGWTIITQSPIESTLLPLTGIMKKVLMRTLPMALAVFLFIWVFARAISRPLQQLADKTKQLDSPSAGSDIEKINSWYVESLSLKKAILSGMKLLNSQIGQLQHDVKTDPLTGASNRRAFQLKLEQLAILDTPFSILAVDIDYFKKINDNYGHKAGDDVLKEMVQIMKSACRDGDMVARTGGEEFILVLKDCPIKDAFSYAERLRITIADKAFEDIGHITVSIGVGSWTTESASIEKTLSSADEALYKAKREGRNRSVIAE
ncbi:diguanylate cyclase [Marinomonas sp. 2405UD66-6]|uniref:sensor domain-containing diguanylate cyclase n=1 Tax=Marinomonas sp. 2405UD66-6 TaxID=3391834 RepID=UPI0039C8FBC5